MLLNSRLASSILSADLFVTICSLIGPLMDWCETRFAFELADVGADIEAGVEVDDDDDDDLSDDALDDDFFSFASC